jgi:malate dehydrogenase (oxaloacetate-decarboxylating)
VNNSLLFPAIFRGALDVRARTISDTMVIAAAKELARHAVEDGLSKDHILPTMEEWEVYPKVAATVGETAVREGHARRRVSRSELLKTATSTIRQSRDLMDALRRRGIIPDPPQ